MGQLSEESDRISQGLRSNFQDFGFEAGLAAKLEFTIEKLRERELKKQEPFTLTENLPVPPLELSKEVACALCNLGILAEVGHVTQSVSSGAISLSQDSSHGIRADVIVSTFYPRRSSERYEYGGDPAQEPYLQPDYAPSMPGSGYLDLPNLPPIKFAAGDYLTTHYQLISIAPRTSWITGADRARDVYTNILSGQRDFRQVSPQILFMLASELAVAGDFDAKANIFDNYIAKSPLATRTDLFRVTVSQADRRRRAGEAQNALALLEGLGFRSHTPEAVAEYLQAKGQCHISIYHKTRRIEDLNSATDCQEQIVSRLRSEEIPLDKKLYYLETMISFQLERSRLSLDSTEASRTLLALDQNLSLYGSYLEQFRRTPAMSQAHFVRALATLEYYSGDRYRYEGRTDIALDYYYRASERFSSQRDKVMATLNWIYCALVCRDSRDDPTFLTMQAFYNDQFYALVQPTELPRYQAEIEFVEHEIGVPTNKPE